MFELAFLGNQTISSHFPLQLHGTFTDRVSSLLLFFSSSSSSSSSSLHNYPTIGPDPRAWAISSGCITPTLSEVWLHSLGEAHKSWHCGAERFSFPPQIHGMRLIEGSYSMMLSCLLSLSRGRKTLYMGKHLMTNRRLQAGRHKQSQ